MNDSIKEYENIINLPHHVSKKHPQMSLEARSAQFAPFAALIGYEDEVKETARITTRKIAITEEQRLVLDSKLQIIESKIKNKPVATFKYFIPDLKKDGGRYVTVTGSIVKIDKYKQIIILADNTKIPIHEIADITGDCFIGQ